MNKAKSIVTAGILTLLSLLLLTACGGGSSDNPDDGTEFTYSTTSSKGDYSEWTLSGSDLNAVWNVVSDVGEIDYTFTIAATCASADSFGSQVCTISSSSCSDGVSACPSAPTDDFSLMEVPGVALFATTDAGLPAAQLHVGFAKNNNACSDDVSGEYVYVHTGLGNRDSFGVYQSDADFINIVHADFGFTTTDDNVTQALSYNTGTPNEAFTDNGCNNGLREREISGGETLRAMITSSGLFVLDLPAGQGGIVAFNTNKAATLADFANKSFGGISFPDNGPEQPLKVEFAALSSNQVALTAIALDGGVEEPPQNLTIKTLTTPATVINPPYPDFTVAPVGYGASPLASSFATADLLPGTFKIDQLDDSGRIILAAMKFNNKVIAIGMVYNFRTMSDIDPSAGDGVTTFSENGLYNTGNFILFEK